MQIKRLVFIIALFGGIVAAGAMALERQNLFVRVATVIRCSVTIIATPHGSEPRSHCVTNDGSDILIVRDRSQNIIKDTVISLP